MEIDEEEGRDISHGALQLNMLDMKGIKPNVSLSAID